MLMQLSALKQLWELSTHSLISTQAEADWRKPERQMQSPPTRCGKLPSCRQAVQVMASEHAAQLASQGKQVPPSLYEPRGQVE